MGSGAEVSATTLAGAVRAFAEGEIKLEAPHIGERSRSDALRYAPSFVRGSCREVPTTAYTVETLARKLIRSATPRRS